MKSNKRYRKQFSAKTVWMFRVGLVIVMIFIWYNNYKLVVNTRQKIQILNQAREEVVSLRKSYFNEIIENEQVSSDIYIERDARDKVNYAKEGDIIFVIPEDILQSDLLETEYQSIIMSDTPTAQKDTWKEWVDFFSEGL